jgi:opacity protein-like surface antigen
MRRLFVLLGLLCWSIPALAGEFELPTLRGSEAFVPPPPPPVSRWSGVYAGGQIGAAYSGADFADTSQELVAHMLRELALESQAQVSRWQLFGKGETRGLTYGAFLGYNVGWEGVVLGIEANWNRTNLTINAPSSSISRVTSANGLIYDVTLAGAASLTLSSIGTLRARAGWDTGNFLPYAMVGAAVAQATYVRTVTVSGTQTDPNTSNVVPFSFTETDGKGDAWIFGAALGFGLDAMVLPQVFVRAEYEYVALFKFAGIKTTVNTGRLGLGFKF